MSFRRASSAARSSSCHRRRAPRGSPGTRRSLDVLHLLRESAPAPPSPSPRRAALPRRAPCSRSCSSRAASPAAGSRASSPLRRRSPRRGCRGTPSMCARNRSISSLTSSRSASSAISCASRAGSRSTPCAISFTDSFNRSRSAAMRTGARAAIRSNACSTTASRSARRCASRAPSASRIFISADTASCTIAAKGATVSDSASAASDTITFGHPEHRLHIHRRRQLVLLLERPQLLHVLAEPRAVDHERLLRRPLHAGREGHVAAGHRRAQQLPRLPLPARERRRELDARIEEPVVHGAHFHRDRPRPQLPGRAPEPGHAPYHAQACKLPCRNAVINSRSSSEGRTCRSGPLADTGGRAGTAGGSAPSSP